MKHGTPPIDSGWLKRRRPGGAETMKAPAELVLVRLKPTGVTVQRYVCFVVENKHVTYLSALPTPPTLDRFLDGPSRHLSW
jgi:hypothetical protein